MQITGLVKIQEDLVAKHEQNADRRDIKIYRPQDQTYWQLNCCSANRLENEFIQVMTKSLRE